MTELLHCFLLSGRAQPPHYPSFKHSFSLDFLVFLPGIMFSYYYISLSPFSPKWHAHWIESLVSTYNTRYLSYFHASKCFLSISLHQYHTYFKVNYCLMLIFLSSVSSSHWSAISSLWSSFTLMATSLKRLLGFTFPTITSKVPSLLELAKTQKKSTQSISNRNITKQLTRIPGSEYVSLLNIITLLLFWQSYPADSVTVCKIQYLSFKQ